MKLVLLLFLGLFVSVPVTQAQTGEQIIDYQVFITVNSDSTIGVQEKIQYDFGTVPRHGIFRIIPYRYSTDYGKITAPISDITVKQDSAPAQFETSQASGTVEVKVGDADTLISGTHLYELEYTVSRSLGYFSDHDELYWNATGTAWQVPIDKAAAIVTLPRKPDEKQIQTNCYTGAQGSVDRNCSPHVTGNVITFAATQPLGPGEGLTVAVGFPKGIVTEPTKTQLREQQLFDNWVVVFPLLALVGMFLIWRRFGKDAKGRGTIVPEYEPPNNLTPIEIGTLVDGKIDQKDISAEIIYLAEQGYLTIEQMEVKKLVVFKGVDYRLKRTDKPDSALSETDRSVLNTLFLSENTVRLTDLRKNLAFGIGLKELKKDVYKDLVQKGYYRSNPVTAKSIPIAVGFLIGIGMVVLFSDMFGPIGIVSSVVTALIIIGFGILMPARTEAGSLAREQILGLKKYIDVAEKDRITFHNSPEKTPARFEKLLPFAMALGVEKAWAKQFEGIYNQNPNWYSGPNAVGFSGVHPGLFNVGAFTDNLGSFADSVRSTVASNASHSSGGGFGGGGFSGGGFGGGGGGSW